MKEAGPNYWLASTAASFHRLGGIWHLDIRSLGYQNREIEEHQAAENRQVVQFQASGMA